MIQKTASFCSPMNVLKSNLRNGIPWGTERPPAGRREDAAARGRYS